MTSTEEKPRPKVALRSRRHVPERTPTELLQKIGLLGKEVVAILIERGWEVEEPRKLQQHKVYHTLEGRTKGDQVEQGRDYFVGEGELYAFILDQGRAVDYAICFQMKNIRPIRSFVSTGQGSLTLMRDIERYLLLFVAAVRRYQRTKVGRAANRAALKPAASGVTSEA
ncbi:hypothetical protein BBJ29_001735 [Phytophthora kernoviae]|uniref:Uncharacterized protein n=1 Tax=Phytophthora kernoviae TaxID=325452 RepID=A0A3F2RTY7_9STRA|nr:hypothetical protein BBP00_00004187 [Phytophthora kernoviae]RLN70208.1 hypothetical protein BBJ29_001735 [Phytophthora kernoviae]